MPKKSWINVCTIVAEKPYKVDSETGFLLYQAVGISRKETTFSYVVGTIHSAVRHNTPGIAVLEGDFYVAPDRHLQSLQLDTSLALLQRAKEEIKERQGAIARQILKRTR